MSVRLNKVVTILNIGLETIQDFLNGKPELGAVGNLTLNSKITDEQFETLAKQFSCDAAIKKQAGNVFSKIKERRKNKSEGEIEKHIQKGLKIIGKIDLDSLNQKTHPAKKMKEEHKKEIGDNTTDGTPIKVSMGEFDFTKHQITYWSNGKKIHLAKQTGLCCY